MGSTEPDHRRGHVVDPPPVNDGPLTFADLAGRDIGALKGVGPKRLEALRGMGIQTILDLLFHYPRRYLDRSNQATIGQLEPGETAMVLASVRSISSRRGKGGRTFVTATVHDGQSSLKVTFFNQAWRERQLAVGTEAIFFGKLEVFAGSRQMTNPVVDLVGNRTGRILPVYPQSEKAGVTTWELGDLVAQALRRIAPRGLADPVPSGLATRLGLIDRDAAFRLIHEPTSMADTVSARRRLVFDELLRLQVALVHRKLTIEAGQLGIRHEAAFNTINDGIVATFLNGLPFVATGAQQRVIGEIMEDLARPVPMHRLIQGDVGSGKTVVAVAALLTAVEGGHQGAFMAPTEVLAEQHGRALLSFVDGMTVPAPAGSLFDNRPLTVVTLTGRVPAAARRSILAGLADGSIDIAIGTHALIEDTVKFASLGVVVIDEQHRFGVDQRDALRVVNADGTSPDVIVMTATPIPRTAAMTVYGDLDVSIVDELPPGRTPILTVRVDSEMALDSMWHDVRSQVADGRQVYVVCPLVEESDKLQISSATETYEDLSGGHLAGLSLGLLHGRMAGADKDDVMGRFRRRELDVLVATTVIEVGVDVPNATIMVILDADRFGIAQLHQLRGRVGRGSAASRCYLVASPEVSDDATERLDALVASTDGFELAEVDLDLRGEGTIMGARQKGRNDLRLASLRRDREWVEIARAAAFELLDGPGGLAAHPELATEVQLLLGDDDTDYLLKN